jgi:peptide/nickel transport system substrate-binding protein
VRVTVVSGLAVAAVLALVAPAAPPAAAAPVGAGDTLTVGVLDLPLGLNPNTAADAGQPALDATAAVLPSVFPAGRLRPRLNRSLFAGAAVTSTAPFTVTYLVRPQAVWSDGVPLGYSDFALAWRAQSGRTGGVTHAVSTDGYRDIRTVTGAATAAGRRITVVFAKPYIEWRSLFSSMLPAHVVTLGEWDNAVSVNLPPLSAGPYAVAATQTPGTLTLVRNLRYPGGRAAIARVVFRQYPSRSTLVGALRRGAVQLVVPATNPEDELPLRGLPGVRAVPVRSVFYEHLDFNLHDPVAGDPAVRHAVARAVDDEAVARAASAAYGGAPAQVTGGRLLQPGQPGYADQRGPDGHGDTVGARALLTAAGWAPGADGVFARGPAGGVHAGDDGRQQNADGGGGGAAGAAGAGRGRGDAALRAGRQAVRRAAATPLPGDAVRLGRLAGDGFGAGPGGPHPRVGKLRWAGRPAGRRRAGAGGPGGLRRRGAGCPARDRAAALAGRRDRAAGRAARPGCRLASAARGDRQPHPGRDLRHRRSLAARPVVGVVVGVVSPAAG